jgi:glucose/mannose-6-phosphate isomerase
VTRPQYLDTLSMWEATAALPEQIAATVAASYEVLEHAALPSGDAIRSVVIFGAGTAGAVAEAVAAYAVDRSAIPISAGNGYECPSFVGSDTLVFAVSFSGDTEETRRSAEAAIAKGAPVVVVSGGGALAAMASAADLPLFGITPGLPAARTALGALMMPVLMTLTRLGILPPLASTFDDVVSSLRRRRDVLTASASPAEDVARRIGRTIPLVYGSIGLTAVAARRWKTQVNENAKTPAFWSVQPELSHNEVAGWGQHGDVTRQVFTLVTLRHAGENPQVTRRFALVLDATDEVVASVITVWAEGDNDLGRFFDLALFGDLVSLHMAGREGIDPGPVPVVRDLETALRH